MLAVALGADYDMGGTPGPTEGRDEFHSVAGAERLHKVLPTFALVAEKKLFGSSRSSRWFGRG